MAKKKIVFSEDELEFIHFLLTEFFANALIDGISISSTICIEQFPPLDKQLIINLQEKLFDYLYET